MSRFFVALLFILSLSSPVLAQQGYVAGRVIDGQTGEALLGATVAVADEALQGTSTADDGAFVLGPLPVGAVKLQVRFVGFRPAREAVIVTVGDTVAVDVALEPASVSLAAIEIIGAARDHRQLPGAATGLSARTVRLVDPIGTQELLTFVPGVNAFADDGIGNSRISIGIRGLNPRRSSRVLVLEDGIPIQPALYVYPNMYYNPPVERIDRVEVIKGSASIRYGPQTMGGVVNYITSRPRREPGVLGRVATGTNGYVSLFTEMGGWSSGLLTPEVQLLLKRGEGFRDNNGFRQLNGTVKLSVTPDDDRTYYVKANANYEHSQATYTGLTPYSFETDPAFNPKDDDVFRVFRAALDVIRDRQYSSRLLSTTRAYVSFFDRDWWREDDVFVRAGSYEPGEPASLNPAPWYTPGDLLRVGNTDTNFGILRSFYVGGVEHAYTWEHPLLGSIASLDAGARVHFERFLDDRKLGEAPDDRTGTFTMPDPDDPSKLVMAVNPATGMTAKSHHYETTALALFAQETLDWGRLRVVPGVRVELFEQEQVDRLDGARYRDATSFVVLPGLGANYALGRFNLFGGVHRGYTPPSSGALNIAAARVTEVSAGLDVQPEKSWNSELGLRGELPWMAFEATVFHLYITDMVAAGRGTAFENLGRVQSYGLELAATLSPARWTRLLPNLHLAYALLETDILEGRIPSAVRAGATVDASGNDLPYAPRHTLTVGLEQRLPFGLALRGDVRTVSQSYTDFENIGFDHPRVQYNRGDTGPVPAYTVVNASARYEATDRLDVQLTVKNALDEVYIGSRLHSNPRQPEASLSSGILPGPRRQVNLGLTYRF